jgi:NAD-dependent DNA ligase
MLDDNGQPLNRLYNRKRMNDRAIDEMIGMSRGILADAAVNQKEAEFLCSWMEANVSFCEDQIVNQLYRRIHEMLIDGILDEEEKIELLGILKEFTGESTIAQPMNMATSFPLCRPEPRVEFPTLSFCLTGKFAYGPRRICEEVVLDRGGKAQGYVTMDLDFLVIGTFSSTDWSHTSYGRKIEKAVEYREKNRRPAIISEDLWARTAFSM